VAIALIRPLSSDEEAEACARMMASSEPWRTLGRTYDACLERMRDETKERYVAVGEDGRALGFIVLNMQGAFVGYIQTVCVAAETRGQGLGARLVRFAEERIHRDSPNVFLCVSSFNEGAKRLYERLGYGGGPRRLHRARPFRDPHAQVARLLGRVLPRRAPDALKGVGTAT
jgi:ribosomal protein S18 acetylase RimI-like enzyme